MATIKEKMQDTNAILERVPGWKQVFDDAVKAQKGIKAQYAKLEQARNAASGGVCGDFLDLAKKASGVEDYKAIWDAMRTTYGTKRVPQVLSDAYSVIRRAMSKGVNGCEGSGDDMTYVKGPITKAESFNSLKVALKLKSQEEAKAAQAANKTPFAGMLDKLAGMYKDGDDSLKAQLEGRLAALLVEAHLEGEEQVKDAADAILEPIAKAKPAPKGNRKAA